MGRRFVSKRMAACRHYHLRRPIQPQPHRLQSLIMMICILQAQAAFWSVPRHAVYATTLFSLIHVNRLMDGGWWKKESTWRYLSEEDSGFVIPEVGFRWSCSRLLYSRLCSWHEG